MVSIVTLGMFNPAGGGVIRAVGGGAPAMPQEEMPRPTLLVTSVHYTKKKKDNENPIKIIIKDVQ